MLIHINLIENVVFDPIDYASFKGFRDFSCLFGGRKQHLPVSSRVVTHQYSEMCKTRELVTEQFAEQSLLIIVRKSPQDLELY